MLGLIVVELGPDALRANAPAGIAGFIAGGATMLALSIALGV